MCRPVTERRAVSSPDKCMSLGPLGGKKEAKRERERREERGERREERERSVTVYVHACGGAAVIHIHIHVLQWNLR